MARTSDYEGLAGRKKRPRERSHILIDHPFINMYPKLRGSVNCPLIRGIGALDKPRSPERARGATICGWSCPNTGG
ncbi:MAG: hypothetical protein V2G45_08915 [bacterium JZ-2024 1]